MSVLSELGNVPSDVRLLEPQLSEVNDVQPLTFNEVNLQLLQSTDDRLLLFDKSSVFRVLWPVMLTLVSKLEPA